jgi:hypothetical protein
MICWWTYLPSSHAARLAHAFQSSKKFSDNICLQFFFLPSRMKFQYLMPTLCLSSVAQKSTKYGILKNLCSWLWTFSKHPLSSHINGLHVHKAVTQLDIWLTANLYIVHATSKCPSTSTCIKHPTIAKETGSMLLHCICLIEIFPKPCTDSACPRIKALHMITSSHQAILLSASQCSHICHTCMSIRVMDASDLYTCTSIEQPYKGDKCLAPPHFMSDLMEKL